jgi:hypothetical protein
MRIPDLIAKSRRVLEDLEAVRDTLAAKPPEEILQNALGAPPPAAPAAAAAPLGGEESPFFESAAPPAPAEPVDPALQAEREAALEDGRRAVEKVMSEGESADLSPREARGLEAIILLFGRPAILIQDGKFFPPPEDWTILESHRSAIERTFQSVGRIEVDGHPSLQWIGTGFLVGPDVLMTNRHVAMEFTAPKSNGRWGIAPGIKARVDFREDLGATQSAEFAIEKLIGIHGRYDMALFRIARQGGSSGTEAAPPPLPIAAHPDSLGPVAGRTVYVVGYPAWDGRRNDPEPMQRLFGNIYNVKRLQPGNVVRLDADLAHLTHDCSTLGGNSGSCVVDLATHQVIGLHFGGRYQEENDAVALWQIPDDPLIKIGGLTFS